ncbi:MAG: DUF1295 domain-containing protein [Candidatus Shapirobacteria bacterium]|jgi:steroid 5-alpha reductase family enzyme
MNQFGFLFLIVIGYMMIWFGMSVVQKRNDVADVAWGVGFIIVAWASFSIGEGTIKAIIVNIMVTIWGGRLARHIYFRNKNKPEDYRYLEWRKTWKNFYLRSFLQVFLLQGILLYIISLPVILINLSQNQWRTIDFVGIILWMIGFWFESTADSQLRKFIANKKNKGKIMNVGLWKYSRHPNYFGEVTMWWGIWLMSLSYGGFWTIVGPGMITYLIVFVSGVPLLEKKFAGRKDWEIYKSKTSVLVPWWSIIK